VRAILILFTALTLASCSGAEVDVTGMDGDAEESVLLGGILKLNGSNYVESEFAFVDGIVAGRIEDPVAIRRLAKGISGVRVRVRSDESKAKLTEMAVRSTGTLKIGSKGAEGVKVITFFPSGTSALIWDDEDDRRQFETVILQTFRADESSTH